MTNIEIIYDGIKLGAGFAASKGAKIIMDGIVEQFTPDDLDNTKKMCVEIAKWGGAAAFGSVCANSVKEKLDRGKALVESANKIIESIKEGSKTAEPVVKDVEDNQIVEIDDPELVEEEDEEDFLK